MERNKEVESVSESGSSLGSSMASPSTGRHPRRLMLTVVGNGGLPPPM